MGLPEFRARDIQDLANYSSYERGGEYADVGAVQNLVVEHETYRAHVYGTHRYTVHIWDDDGEIETSCTCVRLGRELQARCRRHAHHSRTRRER